MPGTINLHHIIAQSIHKASRNANGRVKRIVKHVAAAICSCLGARKKAAQLQLRLLRAAISGKLHGKILSRNYAKNNAVRVSCNSNSSHSKSRGAYEKKRRKKRKTSDTNLTHLGWVLNSKMLQQLLQSAPPLAQLPGNLWKLGNSIRNHYD